MRTDILFGTALRGPFVSLPMHAYTFGSGADENDIDVEKYGLRVISPT